MYSGVLNISRSCIVNKDIFMLNVCQHEKAQLCKQRNTNAQLCTRLCTLSQSAAIPPLSLPPLTFPQTLFGASTIHYPRLSPPLNLLSNSPLVQEGLLQIFRNAETKV